jgi:small subunit ribosomal protein S20
MPAESDTSEMNAMYGKVMRSRETVSANGFSGSREKPGAEHPRDEEVAHVAEHAAHHRQAAYGGENAEQVHATIPPLFRTQNRSMANIKSAQKRARQAVQRREHNMSLRTEVRSAIKNVKKAVAAGNKDDAAKVLRESQRVIDRIVAKGVLHRNAGDRHKSRLAHAIKALK